MTTGMHIEERYVAALSAAGLKDFQSVMETRAGTPVSVHGDRSTIRLRVVVDGDPRELYLKRTLRHAITGLVRDLLFGRRPQARPVREYAICKRLSSLGVPAMKAIAWGQRKRWLLPRQAFVVVEAVPARTSLEKAWRERADGTPRLALLEKRQVIRTVAGIVARLHGADLRWPDLVSKHILLNVPDRSGSPKPEWDLHLIDLERMETSRSEKSRQRDLVKLLTSMPAGSVSRTDRLRFAVAYCGCEDASWPDRRAAISRQFGQMAVPNHATAASGGLQYVFSVGNGSDLVGTGPDRVGGR